VITRFKVKHPRTKIVSFEKVSISDFFFAGLVDLLIQTNKIHNNPPCWNPVYGETTAVFVHLSIEMTPPSAMVLSIYLKNRVD
jgi:hypothetical protein